MGRMGENTTTPVNIPHSYAYNDYKLSLSFEACLTSHHKDTKIAYNKLY
jgi:nitrate reductase cytochrome c-type subunit